MNIIYISKKYYINTYSKGVKMMKRIISYFMIMTMMILKTKYFQKNQNKVYYLKYTIL